VHVNFSPLILKQLELLRSRGLFFFASAVKKLHVAKLLVGNFQYAYVPFGWQIFLDALNVYFGIFGAGASLSMFFRKSA
jgi:hypothetical protein